MKNILLALTLLTAGFANAQNNDGLFEVEYEMNGQQFGRCL